MKFIRKLHVTWAYQVTEEVPLRSLVMCATAYLKEKGQMDTVFGGLSSYAITLMAIAHLQELRKVSL